MPIAAAITLLALLGFDLVLSASIGSELTWQWFGRTPAAVAISIYAFGVACGALGARAVARRWHWSERRRLGLLAAAFGLFGVALLPLPWSYGIAVLKRLVPLLHLLVSHPQVTLSPRLQRLVRGLFDPLLVLPERRFVRFAGLGQMPLFLMDLRHL